MSLTGTMVGATGVVVANVDPAVNFGRELGIGGKGGGGGSCWDSGGGAGGIAADVGCSVGDADPPGACCALSGDANIPNASVAQARTKIRGMWLSPNPPAQMRAANPARIDRAQRLGSINKPDFDRANARTAANRR